MAHPFGNKQAQALVELAVFGTVLIFALTLLLRYGMGANSAQRMQMQTFRKAFARARQYDPNASYNRGQYDPNNSDWTYENANPAFPSNHWRNVSYTVIEDKPVLSASGILPIVERSPVASSTDAVWSIDMFGGMEYGDERDLSRVEFEINGKRYSFTTAAFKEYDVREVKMRTKEDIPNWNGQGPAWRWKTVSSVSAGQMVDVDGDGYEEYVMAVEYEQVEDGRTARGRSKFRQELRTIKILDYQQGEINSSDEEGGLQGYNANMLVDASTFARQEDAVGITTTEGINAEETLRRAIKTTNGDYNVVDTFSQQETETWYTPNE